MRVERFLRDSANRLPDKTALVAGHRRLPYRELDELSDRFASALSSRGIVRGDRVVLFVENGWEAVVAIFGTLKVGAIFVPVHPSTKSEKLAYVLKDCGAIALVTQARLLATAEAVRARCRSVRATFVAGDEIESRSTSAEATSSLAATLAAEARRLPHPGIDLDLAMLIYTSGSTGRPKAVMMTHANIVAAADSITSYLENTADDIILNALPISFDYGLYQVLMSVKLGATVVLENSFAYPQLILEKMRAERVTGFPIVPTIAALLLERSDLEPGTLPDLRYITSTGAPLPPAHIEGLRELFPDVRLYSMYGLTECKRCTFMPPSELPRRPTSVGIPIPNTEAYVVDEHGRRAPAGVVGELVVRGPHVMQGYWGDPVATASVLRPGPYPWERVLHTGDLFHTDADGYFYFVGRKDDIIKSRGQKVSPKEVEDVLYALPGVQEAAVVGLPDPILDKTVKAIVVAAPGADLTPKKVIGHCKARLEDFMVPKIVEFQDALPKTENGKLDRRSLVTALPEAAE